MTKHKYRIDGYKKWYDIGEKLGMKGICRLNEKGFQEKIFDLKVLLCRGEKYEVYGEFPINICSILNPSEPTRDTMRTGEEYLRNYEGKINYTLSAKFVKECVSSLDNTTT